MLRPVEEGDMPVILAKFNGHVPEKYDIRQKHWQGLKPRMSNGRRIWDIIDNNFVLVIERESGHCRIPKTEKNMKMFKKVSQPKMETRSEHTTDDFGNLITKEIEVEVPGRFSRLEENVLQKALGDNLKERVKGELFQEIQEKFDLVPKNQPKNEMPNVNKVVDTKARKSKEEIKAEAEVQLRKEMEDQAEKEKAEADEIEAAKKAADEAHKKEVLKKKRQEQAALMRAKKAEKQKQKKFQTDSTQPAELVTSDSN
jgi:hypothetical protein